MWVKLISRLLGIIAADAVYRRAERECGSLTMSQSAIRSIGCRLECLDDELRRIPKIGPLVIVANHPTGGAEGIGLPALVESVRKDVKTVGHVWFRRWPKIAERMILVNPQATGASRSENRRATREAVTYVRHGGTLVIFPAGEVARVDPARGRITDAPWQRGLARLLRATGATVVPVHVAGRNSTLYYLLSLIHPRLGAALLAREMLKKRGGSLRVRFGEPLRIDWAGRGPTDNEILTTCRRAVDCLSRPSRAACLPTSAVFSASRRFDTLPLEITRPTP